MFDTSSAEKYLISFFYAMNQWEKCHFLSLREGGIREQEKAKKDLDNIFNIYCTIKERKTGRQTSLHCGYPSEYDIDNQPILKTALINKRAIVYTEQLNRLKNKYRYTLHFKNNEWRVDKKERFSSGEDKWVKYGL